MWSSSSRALASSHVQLEKHSQANANDEGASPAGAAIKAAPRSSMRRSWYSQTFSDDECDNEGERSLSAASHGDDETEGVPVSPENCHTADASDANSDASTDVGSDDEEARLRPSSFDVADDFDVDEARLRPSSSRNGKQRHTRPALQQRSVSESAEGSRGVVLANKQDAFPASPMKQSTAADCSEAMAEHRMLKRQRQRLERREQRTKERADRSARRSQP